MRDAASLLPGYSAEEMVEAYAVVGGMPGYLLQLSDRFDLLTNLRRAVFRRDSSGQGWGSWFLADPYPRFWARWILPYTTQIEFGETEALIQESLRPGWDQFAGVAWEELARQHVREMAKSQQIPFWPEEVGSWWSAEAQIDVVASRGARRSALLGEARWRREKVNVADQRWCRALPGRAKTEGLSSVSRPHVYSALRTGGPTKAGGRWLLETRKRRNLAASRPASPAGCAT